MTAVLLYTQQLFPATCYCNDSCTVAFYPFLLDSNFNTETTLIVTTLCLSLHHAVTALILNIGTVGTKVLTSRHAHFTPGNDPRIY